MKKKCCLIISVIFVLLFSTSIVFSHSGGTDSNGGHHDYSNVSGLGDYHYHHGYGPHLHTDGICPYESDNQSNVSYASSEETYTFTEDELYEYVLDTVRNNPSNYGMVHEDDYNNLIREQEETLKYMISTDEAFEDTMTGVGITAAIGILACYLIYRKYSK